MRILSWVQSKIGIRHDQKRREGNASGNQSCYPNELDNQCHGILTIGTLGNCESNGGDSRRIETAESSCSEQDIPDFTVEELHKLQGALTKLLSRKSREYEKGAGEGNHNLPLNRFLNCPSSLEIDRCTCERPCDVMEKGEGCISPATKAILNRMKDALRENRNAIHRRSFAFLLKKVFVCAGGFAPAPSLRDPLPASRMEKIMKALLRQKFYPKNAARTATKRFLDKRPADECEAKDETDGGEDNQSKWVKTDPDYIVLEI